VGEKKKTGEGRSGGGGERNLTLDRESFAAEGADGGGEAVMRTWAPAKFGLEKKEGILRRLNVGGPNEERKTGGILNLNFRGERATTHRKTPGKKSAGHFWGKVLGKGVC